MPTLPDSGDENGDDDGTCIAEDPHLPVRTIVAPRTGVFIPVVKPGVEGEELELTRWDVVGLLDCQGEKVDVTSPFDGTLMGLLVESGERVRPDQPVAWLRL